MVSAISSESKAVLHSTTEYYGAGKPPLSRLLASTTHCDAISEVLTQDIPFRSSIPHTSAQRLILWPSTEMLYFVSGSQTCVAC